MKSEMKRPVILNAQGKPARTAGFGTYGSGPALTHGGYRNPLSGAGGHTDKSDAGFFQPTYLQSRQQLETIYVESWACRKFIDIPIDDMTIRWRSFEGEDEGQVEAMKEAEAEYQVVPRLTRAMKAGRLYGTGLLVMVTREAELSEPLDPEAVRPGDLIHLLPLDRHDANRFSWDENPYSPTYGQTIEYFMSPTLGRPFHVHASRVLRFDGLTPLSASGYTVYQREWGVSCVIPVLLSLLQDQAVASGASHLTNEASIPVLRLSGLREAMTGRPDPGDLTPAQMGEAINTFKSLYRTMFLDSGDEFERVSVTWSGLPDLMDRFARRLAAAADIPATRFWGQSPVGMNATGESDMKNYASNVAAQQKRLLTEPLRTLDMVLARSAGLAERLPYSWPSIIDASDEERAAVSKARAEAVKVAVDAQVIDENEARAALDGDELFGELEEWPDITLPRERETEPAVEPTREVDGAP